MVTAERDFNNPIPMPKDISEDFYERFNRFLNDSADDIRGYFNELLTFKRCAFSLEFGCPARIAQEMEKFLKENRYFVWNDMEFVEKGDENEEYFDQELFDQYPDEPMVACMMFVSYREDFVHVAQIVENSIYFCADHDNCDPRGILRGLLYGYGVENIVGFFELRGIGESKMICGSRKGGN